MFSIFSWGGTSKVRMRPHSCPFHLGHITPGVETSFRPSKRPRLSSQQTCLFVTTLVWLRPLAPHLLHSDHPHRGPNSTRCPHVGLQWVSNSTLTLCTWTLLSEASCLNSFCEKIEIFTCQKFTHLKYPVQYFWSIHKIMQLYHHYLIPEYFLIPQITLYPIPLSPSSQPP